MNYTLYFEIKIVSNLFDALFLCQKFVKLKRIQYVMISGQIQAIQKVERQIQAKYKYLSDFANHEYSPNLRKNYNDSISKRSHSQSKRSSYHNSNQRRSSHKKSYQRVEKRSKNLSPPCTTFNPRREITQEEFSPYDQRTDKDGERLNKELLEENSLLRTQLSQKGQTIDSLNNLLAKKQGEIIQIRNQNQADLRYFQQVVSEMTNQIQIVLTKNKILQNQLISAKTKFQEQLRRLEQQYKYQQQKRRVEQYRKKEEKKYQDLRRAQELRRVEDVRRNMNVSQPITKRSVGKLMSRPINQQSLGTSKIKIQQDSQFFNQSNFETMKQNDKTCSIMGDKENRKSEELISSIKSMQIKISGEQSASLKDLWKWLKGIGHAHSCLKRWKSKAIESSTYSSSQKLKELVRQACGYIQ